MTLPPLAKLWKCHTDRILYSAARIFGWILKFESCNKLHAGGPSLAPCPTAYRVDGHFHGVVMPIGPRANINLIDLW